MRKSDARLRTTIKGLTATLFLSFAAANSALAESGAISSALVERVRPHQLETPATSERKEADPSSADDLGPTSSEIAIGDRLKVSVYMVYGSGNGLGADSQGALPTLVEQPSLSGEYVVQETGKLFLPVAGSVKVLGSSMPAASKAIEGAFAQGEAGTIKIGLQLIGRDPVYVTGSIPNPAVLKYSPGMTVLQASIMAGAGQLQSAADQRLRDLEFTRERERVQQSTDNLAKALARRAVLTSERSGVPPSVPITLSQLLPNEAAAVLGDAQSLRESELRKTKEQNQALDSALDAMKKELALLQNNLSQTESWSEELTARVRILEPMFKTGTVTSAAMFAARSDLATAREKAQDTKQKMAQLERDMSANKASKDLLKSTAIFEREKALKEINDTIQQEEVTRGTMGAFLLSQQAVPSPNESPTAKPQYKILRRTADGQKELSAEETTLLRPGDILQILAPPASWRSSFLARGDPAQTLR